MIITDLVHDPAGCRRETDSQGRHWGPYVNLNDEYVELQNNSSHRHEISGWRVRDQDGHTYVFPLCDQLEPGATFRLHTGVGTDTASAFYWNRKAPVWNNDGDKASLINLSGEVVSEFASRQGRVTLYGHVYVAGTQGGVGGAFVLVAANSGVPGVTDPGGAYSMPVDTGPHAVQATADGYFPSAVFGHVFRLSVPMVEQNFELSPSGVPGGTVIDIDVSCTTPSSSEWNSPIAVSAEFHNNGAPITSVVAYLHERSFGGGDDDWVAVDDVILMSAYGGGDTWSHTFTVPPKTWNWNPGEWGFVAVDETEREFEYRVVCVSEPQSLAVTRYSDVHNTSVRVSDSKVDAADTYNGSGVMTLSGFVCAVAAVTAGFPPAALVTAAVASVVGIALVASSFLLRSQASLTMADPISFSSLYSRIVRPVVNQVSTRSQDATRVAGVALFNSASTVAGCSQAALECRDRLATANLYGAPNLIAKQERKLQELKDRITASVDRLDLLKDQVLAAFGADFSLTMDQFDQVKGYLTTHPVPPGVVTGLTRAGLSVSDIEQCRQMVLQASPTSDQLNLPSGLTSMVSSARRDVGHLFTELERLTF
jgi:hypothetical protein